MKKNAFIIFCLSLLLITLKSKAQTVVIDKDTDKVYTVVEKEPEFKGGAKAFYKYLQESLHYPEIAKKNNIQGKVFLSFVVEKDGSITEVKVARGLSKELDDESVRVIQNSPKWIPGAQNGKPVRVQYIMPISFSLIKR